MTVNQTQGRAAVRRHLRAARRDLPASAQRAHAAAAVRLLGRLVRWQQLRRIALYLPADGELNPLPLLWELSCRPDPDLRSGQFQNQKRGQNRRQNPGEAWGGDWRPDAAREWFLPVLRRHAAGRLWFVRWRPPDRLRPNRFGILEPSARRGAIRPAWHLDLVLLPLVGFDDRCNRLGMGGGYYDRSLAWLRQRQHWRRPRLIGLAHECQRLEHIEPRRWDVPLDAVVTEARVYDRGCPGALLAD